VKFFKLSFGTFLFLCSPTGWLDSDWWLWHQISMFPGYDPGFTSWPKPGSHLNPNPIPMGSHYGVFLLKTVESANLGVESSWSVHKPPVIFSSFVSHLHCLVTGEQGCLCLGQNQLFTSSKARRNANSQAWVLKKTLWLVMHVCCKKKKKREREIKGN